MLRIRAYCAACTVTFAVMLCGSPAAFARPMLSFSLSRQADAGAKSPFSWSAKRVPSKARIVVQRQVGTAHVWRTVQRLGGRGGSSQVPGLAMGSYRLRLAVMSRSRKLLAERRAPLLVFATVSLTTLFPQGGSGVKTTATQTFPYALAPGDGTGAIKVQHNPCRSIHFDYYVDGNSEVGDGKMVVVQETKDPVSSSAAIHGFGALTADLVVGQSWSVNLLSEGYDTSLYGGTDFYVNGNASCYRDAPLG